MGRTSVLYSEFRIWFQNTCCLAYIEKVKKAVMLFLYGEVECIVIASTLEILKTSCYKKVAVVHGGSTVNHSYYKN